VRENLRQECVWRVVNASQQENKWWSYVNGFQDQCSGSKSTWNQACSQGVLRQYGIDVNSVERCVNNSGSTDTGTNVILDQMISTQLEFGIFLLPQILINLATYHGTYYCPDIPSDFSKCGVFQAICSGFLEGAEPVACNTSPGCQLAEIRDECGICGGNNLCSSSSSSSSSPSISVGAIIAIVVVSAVLVGLGVYIYIKRQSRIMRQDIDSILKQYLPLEGGGQQIQGDPTGQQRLINSAADQQ